MTQYCRIPDPGSITVASRSCKTQVLLQRRYKARVLLRERTASEGADQCQQGYLFYHRKLSFRLPVISDRDIVSIDIGCTSGAPEQVDDTPSNRWPVLRERCRPNCRCCRCPGPQVPELMKLRFQIVDLRRLWVFLLSMLCPLSRCWLPRTMFSSFFPGANVSEAYLRRPRDDSR